jgi:hypothetical protein
MTARLTTLSPSHLLIRTYHRSLSELRGHGVEHESALRQAFQSLLADTARLHGWTLIAEQSARAGGHRIRPDATLRDANSLTRGYWEAKDSCDTTACYGGS